LIFAFSKDSSSHAQFAVSLPGSPTPSTPSCAQPVFFLAQTHGFIDTGAHTPLAQSAKPKEKIKTIIVVII
jgi:hypothetical protein